METRPRRGGFRAKLAVYDPNSESARETRAAVEAAEAELPRGAKATTAALLADAKPTHENAFKLPLVERTLAAVLTQARG